jgi:membrane protein
LVRIVSWAALRELASDTGSRLRGRDLALRAAGLTVFAALSVVPMLLAAIRIVDLLVGDERLDRFSAAFADSFPDAMGAPAAVERVLRAGESLGWVGLVFALVMATGSGVGIRRALVPIAPADHRENDPAWRLRLLTLPVLGMAPVALAGLLAAAPWLRGLGLEHGPIGVALGSFGSLVLVWVLLWLPLTWTYRVVGPGRPGWAPAFGGAVFAAAFVSGFLQGFLVFLAVPVDLGRPFGGLTEVGAATALLLWLWVLNLVVIVGYALTWTLDPKTGGHAGLQP